MCMRICYSLHLLLLLLHKSHSHFIYVYMCIGHRKCQIVFKCMRLSTTNSIIEIICRPSKQCSVAVQWKCEIYGRIYIYSRLIWITTQKIGGKTICRWAVRTEKRAKGRVDHFIGWFGLVARLVDCCIFVGWQREICERKQVLPRTLWIVWLRRSNIFRLLNIKYNTYTHTYNKSVSRNTQHTALWLILNAFIIR